MVEIGETIPKVELVDTELQTINLKKQIKGKPAILAFFPGAFTGVCTAELCTLRDSMAEFNSMNGTVYAISVDGPFANKGFKEKNNLNFTILSDFNKKAIKKFNVIQENFAHLDKYTTAKKAIFVTDKKGVVQYKWVSDDPGVEPDYNAIRSALASIK